MGYDVSIGSFSSGYTYNVSALFHKHITSILHEDTGLRMLHGMTGKKAFMHLSAAFERIEAEYLSVWKSGDVGASNFRKLYDPDNGWGSTVGALLFLARLMAACAENPRRILTVS